ncbi:MAG TPA: NfeD family protein [Thermoplasmata archaeon]|nr:NfeD family protein [Thermoplasmata archaeon]
MVDSGTTLGLILIIGGLVLITFEFIHPGAFLLIPGTVVLAGGIMYVAVPGFLTGTVFGPLIVTGVGILSIFVTLPYYQHVGKIHRPMSTTTDSLEGEVGLVIADVVPDSTHGKVRLRSEVWSARAERPIPIGTRVKVVGGEGVTVWVKPLDVEAPTATG